MFLFLNSSAVRSQEVGPGAFLDFQVVQQVLRIWLWCSSTEKELCK